MAKKYSTFRCPNFSGCHVLVFAYLELIAARFRRLKFVEACNLWSILEKKYTSDRRYFCDEDTIYVKIF